MATEKKAPSKRELIEPTKGDKRYVRRKADGTFRKTVDVGKFANRRSEAFCKNQSAQRPGGSRRRKKNSIHQTVCWLAFPVGIGYGWDKSLKSVRAFYSTCMSAMTSRCSGYS
jgi:hypothetical protein